MHYARQSDEVITMLNRRYARFYSVAETALFNSAITILYSVFESRPETVNFHRLRDTFESTADPLFFKELEQSFAEIQSTWTRIAALRNTVVGHKSFKVTDRQKKFVAEMSIQDIRTMLENCKQLLFEIGTKVQDRHFHFNINGTLAFDNLMAD